MKQVTVTDISRRFTFNRDQVYKQCNDFYTKFTAIDTKYNTSKYLFQLIGLSSKFTPMIDLIFQRLIIHDENSNFLSLFAIKVLCDFYKYLSVYQFEEKTESNDKPSEIIFGVKPQIEIRRIIIEMADCLNKQSIVKLDFEHRGYRGQIPTDCQENTQKYRKIIEIFSNQTIENFVKMYSNKVSDQILNNYMWRIQRNIRSMFPQNPEGRQIMIKKVLQELEPLYGFTLTQKNNKNVTDAYKTLQIVVAQLDRYEYHQKIKKTNELYLKGEGIFVKDQNCWDKQEKILNLEDIIINLKYYLPSEQKKNIMKNCLEKKLLSDIVSELIQYYSLTKKGYPALNPLNILYNTLSNKFFLQVSPIILSVLGFNLNKLPSTYKQESNTDKIERYQNYFSAFGKITDNFQQLLLVLKFYQEENTDFILPEQAEKYFSQINFIQQTIQEQKISLQQTFSIKLTSSNIFQLNHKLSCNAIAIDIHYSDHNICWLKFAMCSEMMELINEQRKINNQVKGAGKIMMLYLTFRMFYCLKLAILSRKNVQRSLAMKQFFLLSEKLKENKNLSGKNNQIITELLSYIKIFNNYFIYLQAKQYDSYSENIQITRIRLLDFNKYQKILNQIKDRIFLKNDGQTDNLSRAQYILLEALIKVNEDNLEWMHFHILGRIKKFRILQTNQNFKAMHELILKLL